MLDTIVLGTHLTKLTLSYVHDTSDDDNKWNNSFMSNVTVQELCIEGSWTLNNVSTVIAQLKELHMLKLGIYNLVDSDVTYQVGLTICVTLICFRLHKSYA